MSGPEELQTNQETDVEARDAVAERLETLQDSPEKAAELSERDIEARTEKARNDALEKAVSVESAAKDDKKAEKHSQTVRRNVISKKELNNSYKRTLKQVQSELPVGSRLFSKVVHNGAVERTSEIVGSTIARPNAMLSGAIAAFVLTLIVYTTAKTIGYALSGSETIIAFIIGWVIGIIFDYLRILFTGKK